MSEFADRDALLDQMVEDGLITADQAGEVWDEHERTGKPVREVVLDLEFVNEDDILLMTANQLGTEVVTLEGVAFNQQILHAIPSSVARMYSVVPVDIGQNSVTLATSELLGPEVRALALDRADLAAHADVDPQVLTHALEMVGDDERAGFEAFQDRGVLAVDVARLHGRHVNGPGVVDGPDDLLVELRGQRDRRHEKPLLAADLRTPFGMRCAGDWTTFVPRSQAESPKNPSAVSARTPASSEGSVSLRRVTRGWL